MTSTHGLAVSTSIVASAGTRKAGAQDAPAAPVSRPGPRGGAGVLDACYARHTGPQGAAIADTLRLLLAVWAARAAHTGRRRAKGAAGPLPPALTKGGRRAMNVAVVSDKET